MNYFVRFLFNIIKYMLVSLAIGLLPSLSLAQTQPNTQPNTTINDKPIAIDADNQKIDIQKNIITFTGNVVITQEGLKIKADTVVITNIQSENNQVITAHGKPVYFEQVIENNAKQTIKGSAKQLVYQVKHNSVTLQGDAQLFQQDNQIISEHITYDIINQKIEAKSGKGNQVKTTIIPNQVKEIER